jgi:hypothetical protein
MMKAENIKNVGSPPPTNMKEADIHIINSKAVGSIGNSSSNNQLLALQ